MKVPDNFYLHWRPSGSINMLKMKTKHLRKRDHLQFSLVQSKSNVTKLGVFGEENKITQFSLLW